MWFHVPGGPALLVLNYRRKDVLNQRVGKRIPRPALLFPRVAIFRQLPCGVGKATGSAESGLVMPHNNSQGSFTA